MFETWLSTIEVELQQQPVIGKSQPPLRMCSYVESPTKVSCQRNSVENKIPLESSHIEDPALVPGVEADQTCQRDGIQKGLPSLESSHLESRTTGSGNASEHSFDRDAKAVTANNGPESAHDEIMVGELLGIGLQGSVSRGVNKKTGSSVAIKRICRDTACPIRFLELHGQHGGIIHAEGHIAINSVGHPMEAELAFNEADQYGAEPCPPEIAAGCFLAVFRGGGVTFAEKASNALSGRARGLLVINNDDSTEPFRVDGIAVSSVMIPLSDGQEALALLHKGPVNVVLRTDAEQEAAIICSLPRHPHIIRYFDSWEDGNTTVITMEFCSGGQLKASIGLEDAKRMTVQMIDAVQHLHACGVCHRDLKLSNFLLTAPLSNPEATLVLIDFSMATRARRVSLCCGSVPYLAPEVLNESYGFERDLWSIGVIVHQLVTGALPFKNTDHDAILEWLELPDEVEFEAEVWSDIPSEAKLFVMALLRKDPLKRISLAEAARHPWLKGVEISPRRKSFSSEKEGAQNAPD